MDKGKGEKKMDGFLDEFIVYDTDKVEVEDVPVVPLPSASAVPSAKNNQVSCSVSNADSQGTVTGILVN